MMRCPAGLGAFVLAALTSCPGAAADAFLRAMGPPTTVQATGQSCDINDYPDAPARAFRNRDGLAVLISSHFTTRKMMGPGLNSLRHDCAIALNSGGNADPSAYDDKSWITATWTTDGMRVDALIHHEYQANTHKGRCNHAEYMRCWFNTILGATSYDGGMTFSRNSPPRVIAGAPFPQDRHQGRHRGFFNPSNIFSDGTSFYFISNTTGWDGQAYGACLFRAASVPSGDWKAWDGKAFSVSYSDPYTVSDIAPAACKVLQPFSASVGSVTKIRESDVWVAVFQVAGRTPDEPSGFYYSTSTDLLRWSRRRLLVEGKTLYDSPCNESKLINYPSLIDADALGRNFDDVGRTAALYFTEIEISGCKVTARRELKRIDISIELKQ
jgi:hypothetical protein